VSSSNIASDTVSLDELRIDQSGTYWIEKRPAENGRCVIVRILNGLTEDCLPEPFSARSKVHEYGGGAYCITEKEIYFVNDMDQSIYLASDYEAPQRITQTKHLRYADLTFDQYRNQLICICEDHSSPSQEPVNKLIVVNLSTGELATLCNGYDFYSNPRLSPDGQKLAWLCWNHPNMPWDGTELWLANINPDNALTDVSIVAGSDTISIFQPEWSKDNILHFISDQSGWWNLYNYEKTPRQLTHTQFEFGLPQWVFAQSCYTFINRNEILCTFLTDGEGKLALFNRQSKKLSTLDIPWSSFSSIQSFNNTCVFIAASNKTFPKIISADIRNLRDKKPRTLNIKSSVKTRLDETYYAYGEKIHFKTRDNSSAFAIYYSPTSKDFTSDKNEKPPLIVLTHGGPTAMASAKLDMRKQFWTSRGFALLDVNYSGSTGFGRTYRDRLNHHWGIRDAEDCCDAALHAADLGLADPKRLIIKGSSAGGYTVLCALAFHNTFSAGASYYGIGNLETLLSDTHKFESKYTHRLVGPYPEKLDLYKQRSPLLHVDNLNCPVIFFQGTDDKVVPKEQAEKMFEALKNKGIPVAYIPFSGEGHGFRKAENIKYALDAELAFYSRIFNLNRDDDISITIENMDRLEA
jgi:dipeptidyl aminopeptidase/acylaminoacyl peptidase